MRIPHWKSKVTATAVYLGILAVLYKYQVPCVFQSVLGICCPGCGMTRAMLAALQLDFRTAFSYHAMFWSVPVLYLYLMFGKKLFPKQWLNRVMLSGIGVGFLANWLLRLW